MTESDSSDDEFVEAKESWDEVHRLTLELSSSSKFSLEETKQPLASRKISDTMPIDIPLRSVLLKSDMTTASNNRTTVVKFPKPSPTKSRFMIKKNYSRVPPITTIQTQRNMKDFFEYNPLGLQQEIRASACAITVAQFSVDGFFFATAGEDTVIRIWEISDFTYNSNA